MKINFLGVKIFFQAMKIFFHAVKIFFLRAIEIPVRRRGEKRLVLKEKLFGAGGKSVRRKKKNSSVLEEKVFGGRRKALWSTQKCRCPCMEILEGHKKRGRRAVMVPSSTS